MEFNGILYYKSFVYKKCRNAPLLAAGMKGIHIPSFFAAG
jgi:hypothetical protein